jgi:hypothetical protein
MWSKNTIKNKNRISISIVPCFHKINVNKNGFGFGG